MLVQLEHLRTLPVIAARISSRRIRLHAWMYKIESGEVYYFDSDEEQFVAFGATRPTRSIRCSPATANRSRARLAQIRPVNTGR